MASAGRDVGACSPVKILEKSVQLGAFLHIFKQFISCSERIIHQQAKLYTEQNF